MVRLLLAGLTGCFGMLLAADAPQLPPAVIARLGTLRDPSEGLAAIALSPDGQLLAAGGYDKTIRIWDLKTRKEIHRLPESQWIVSLAFSPDGKTLAGGRLWDLATGKALPQPPPRGAAVRTIAFAPDGKTLAIAYDDKVTQLIETATGKVLQKLPDDLDWITALAISPDGKLLAAGGHGEEDFRLFDTATGKELHRFPKHTDWVNGLAFTKDGKVLVSASADRTIRLWDTASYAELGPSLEDVDARLFGVSFSSDGRTVAAGTNGNAIALWEIASGQLIRRFEGHQGEVRGVVFMPNGRSIASASTDGTVLIWDITGWSEAGVKPPIDLSAEALERCWTDLAGKAADAHKAKWQLVAAKQAVPFLAEKLKPVDPGRITRLVADLDADDFDKREKAMAELEKLGPVVEPALKKALDGKPSLEMTRRIEDLQKKLKAKSGNRLQVLRAIETLDLIGTPEAKKVAGDLGK